MKINNCDERVCVCVCVCMRARVRVCAGPVVICVLLRSEYYTRKTANAELSHDAEETKTDINLFTSWQFVFHK